MINKKEHKYFLFQTDFELKMRMKVWEMRMYQNELRTWKIIIIINKVNVKRIYPDSLYKKLYAVALSSFIRKKNVKIYKVYIVIYGRYSKKNTRWSCGVTYPSWDERLANRNAKKQKR